NFFDLGGHSLLLAQLHVRLNELFDNALTVIDLFRYPTISSLAEYLNERQPSSKGIMSAITLDEPLSVAADTERSMTDVEIPPNAIAIIGIAARFPGCRDVNEFWEKLKEG